MVTVAPPVCSHLHPRRPIRYRVVQGACPILWDMERHAGTLMRAFEKPDGREEPPFRRPGAAVSVGNDMLDRLLTTLAVRIHAFAMCEIKSGWRLVFEPMDAVTIHYVLNGSGTVRISGGIDVTYAPLSIIVVPAKVVQSLGETHAVKAEANASENCGMLADRLVKFTAGDGSRDTIVVCATISASYGGALGLFDTLRGPVVDDVSHDDTTRRLFGAMLAEIAAPGVGTQALTEAMMKQCLILLLRRHLAERNVRSPFFAMLQDRRLACAVAAIVEQPSAAHTVESLASIAAMSRSTFAARFAETFGQTPIDFVQHVRLRLGADLLQTTDLPVKLIAASVGYASRSHFARAFRNAYATDPTSFRTGAARREQDSQLATEPTFAERVVSGVESLLEEES